MRQASKRIPESAEKTVRDIRRATHRHHSAEEKIRIVLEGLRGEDSIAELCRKEGINQNLYYRWTSVTVARQNGEAMLCRKRATGLEPLEFCFGFVSVYHPMW
jgi:transposase-like protein